MTPRPRSIGTARTRTRLYPRDQGLPTAGRLPHYGETRVTQLTVKDVLSKISGLPPKEIDKIADEVRANHIRLHSCPGPHDFRPTDPAKKLGQTYLCTRCGGRLESVEHSWYEEGLAHGRAERR
jgi:hypothetical protein